MRALLALLLICAGLSAQDNHYWTHQFGTRSALMGGAVIGGVSDTSAVYYNPARLGWVNNDSLKVSADGYQLSILTLTDGAGAGRNITSTQGDIVPLTGSGVFLFEQANIGLGFQILARQFFNARASTRVERRDNVIEDTRSPGNEHYIGSFQFDTSTEEYWAGLGFGWAITDWLAIGITHWGALRFETRGVNITTRAVNDTGQTFGAGNAAGWDVWNVRMLWKAGISMQFDGLKMGMTLTTPSLNMFGSGTVWQQISVDDLDIDGNGSSDEFEANDRRDGVATEVRSPLSIASGVEYDFGPVLLGFAWEWFLPVGRYKVAAPQGDKAFIIGPFPSQSSRKLLTVHDGKRGAFNGVIGMEARFHANWTGFWSMRTDANADYLGFGNDLHLGMATWNLFHFATGISFTTRQDDNSPKHELMLGLQFALGSGTTQQPINFDNPREDELLTGYRKRIDISYFSVSLLVGYTYYF